MNPEQRPWAHVSRRHVIPDPHLRMREELSADDENTRAEHEIASEESDPADGD
ncbi:MAG TPA: hypothetical protein VF215_03475 [Thermoanaerobaculia bacterium]